MGFVLFTYNSISYRCNLYIRSELFIFPNLNHHMMYIVHVNMKSIFTVKHNNMTHPIQSAGGAKKENMNVIHILINKEKFLHYDINSELCTSTLRMDPSHSRTTEAQLDDNFSIAVLSCQFFPQWGLRPCHSPEGSY
jgi:hypothetical protein